MTILDLPLFHGATFDAKQDGERLGRQYRKVLALMLDGSKRTLREISDAVGAPEASCSARLRDMRADGYEVERERVPGMNGLWRYWVKGGNHE